MKKRSLNSKYKRGNAVLDVIFMFIVIFIISIVGLVSWQIWGEVSPDIKADINDSAAEDVINEVDSRGASMLDGAFIFIFIGLWIFVIVASLMIDAHPFFFILALILLIFAFIGFGMFGNFYEEFFNDATWGTLTSSFPATYWIMTHLLPLGIGIAITVAIGLYAKSQL